MITVALPPAAEKLQTLHKDILKCRDTAIAWSSLGILMMIHAGNILIEQQHEVAGNFDEWLAFHEEQIGFGRSTAFNYMGAARRVANVGGIDKAIEDFATQQELLIALGILQPRPESNGKGNDGGKTPLYRLKFDLPKGPPLEEWEPMDLREFVSRTNPIVDLNARAQVILSGV